MRMPTFIDKIVNFYKDNFVENETSISIYTYKIYLSQTLEKNVIGFKSLLYLSAQDH